jgi:predicted DNA-binding transcriptional regulator YafY
MIMRVKDPNRNEKRHRFPEIEKERKLYRLLFILQRGRRAMHVRDLSSEFGVSERSIERDLMVLEGAGFALEQLGRGTYRFMDDNLIPARR